jgi:hypothetical protein
MSATASGRQPSSRVGATDQAHGGTPANDAMPSLGVVFQTVLAGLTTPPKNQFSTKKADLLARL